MDPENLVLSLTRLRDFLVEREVKELSLPVYDSNRGPLHPRKLYALIHVVFSDTNIQLYLHKKYHLTLLMDRRLMDRDFALEDPEVVMLLAALINLWGMITVGDRPMEVLLMAAYGERGVLDSPNIRVIRWRNGALSGRDLANEP